MGSFQVNTEALTAASAVVARSGQDVGGAHGAFNGASGACDQTPAEPGYAMFVAQAGTALASMHAAAADLSRALNAAAMAYQVAEGTAASSLQVGGR